MIAEYINNKNFNVNILDSEAENLNYEETVDRIIDIDPILVCFSIYGQQPFASTQCMPAAMEHVVLIITRL